MSRFIESAATEDRADRKYNCQRLFLTYAQVGDADINDLLDLLEHSSPKFRYAEACEEEHEDGGRHFHALVVYNGRYTAAYD